MSSDLTPDEWRAISAEDTTKEVYLLGLRHALAHPARARELTGVETLLPGLYRHYPDGSLSLVDARPLPLTDTRAEKELGAGIVYGKPETPFMPGNIYVDYEGRQWHMTTQGGTNVMQGCLGPVNTDAARATGLSADEGQEG